MSWCPRGPLHVSKSLISFPTVEQADSILRFRRQTASASVLFSRRAKSSNLRRTASPLMLRWQRAPAEILYGKGSAEFLKGVRRGRTALIADRALLPFGPLGQINDWLRANGSPLTRIEFHARAQEPSTRTAEEAAGRLRDFEPDLVVAVGGGSTLELAKAAWSLYEHPHLDAPALLRTPALPALRSRARLIALPATAGSGAEVTPTLGLFQEGRFRELRVPSLIPDRAILDPNLSAGLPPEAAAASRFDALAHAVESCFSNLPGPMADVHARAALPLLLNGPDSAFADAAGRESLLYASTMAGLAAGNKHLGLAHAAANALCVYHPLPHGEALALVLPEVIRFNAKSAGKRAGALVRAVNLEGAEDLADRVEAFRLELGLRAELPSAGPDPKRCPIQPEAFVQDVLTSVHLPTNPRRVTGPDVHRLLEKIQPCR